MCIHLRISSISIFILLLHAFSMIPLAAVGDNLNLLGTFPGLNFANDLVVSGATVYMAVQMKDSPVDISKGGLWIFDVSDPSQPTKLGQFIPNYQSLGTQVLDVSGTIACIAATDGSSYQVETVDVSVLSAPFRVDGYTPVICWFYGSGWAEYKGLKIVQNKVLAFSNGGGWGLGESTYESYISSSVSSYAFPLVSSGDTLIGVNTGDDAISTGFAVSGSLIFLSGGNTGLPNGLHIYETSNGYTNAVLRASLGTPGQAIKVALSGSTALIADGAAGLTLVDVQNPSQPSLISVLALPGQANNVTTTGAVACVSLSDQGVALVDFSDPAQPQLMGSYDTEGQPQQAVYEAGQVYIADGTNGLVILGYTGDAPGPTVTPTQTPIVTPTPTATPLPPSEIVEWIEYE